MKYYFRYKRYFYWKKTAVIGHKLEDNCMTLYKEDGGIETIPDWSKYSLRLEADWVLAVKKNMDNSSGMDIKVKAV